MATGDGGLLVLGGGSGGHVVSLVPGRLPGLVVSVASGRLLRRLLRRLLQNLACAGPFNRGSNQSD